MNKREILKTEFSKFLDNRNPNFDDCFRLFEVMNSIFKIGRDTLPLDTVKDAIREVLRSKRHVYSIINKDEEPINVAVVLCVYYEYEFVLLESGDVGMINTKTKEFISDEFQCYSVSTKDIMN